MAIRDRRHAKCATTPSLAGIDVTPAIGEAYGHVTSQWFHREMNKTIAMKMCKYMIAKLPLQFMQIIHVPFLLLSACCVLHC